MATQPDAEPSDASGSRADPESLADHDSRPPDAARPPAVAVHDLQKVYGSGDDEVRAVDGVSFEIEPGTAVGLLGPNGAGKTTTIKSLLGLVVPTEGRVRMGGVDVHEEPKTVYRHVGAMLEGARNVYWRLTVRRNLRFFVALAGGDPAAETERYEALLDQFGLAAKADVPVRELSRGQQQKVSLACTLARDAEVLFLDEPTLGLDVESSLELRRELRRLVEEGGRTVVLSSHDMDVIEDVCDRVIILNDGEVVADDAVETLLHRPDSQRYRIAVEGPIPDDVRSRLRSGFDAGGFERDDGRVRFEATVGSDGFYDLVDVLRDAGLRVDRVDAVDADLEGVFLDITGDGGERP